MNVDEIVKLMKAASDCGLTAVEIKEGEFKLSLKKEKKQVLNYTITKEILPLLRAILL